MEKKQKTTQNKKKIVIAAIVAVCLLAIIILGGLVQILNRKKNITLIYPTGIMVDSNGVIYATDTGGNDVVRIVNGKAQHVAGKLVSKNIYGKTPGGYSDGSSEEALFSEPYALTEWLDGIVVSDSRNNCLRLIRDDKVQTLAGTGAQGNQDGAASMATFNRPKGLAVDTKEQLYIADSLNGCVRRLDQEGNVTTVITDLAAPSGLCWYKGALYISDIGSNQILKWQDEHLTVVAGRSYDEQDMELTDGKADSATFASPAALTVVNNVIYVADTDYAAIRKIEHGQVETICRFDGTGGKLWPAKPSGIVEKDGILYVADSFASTVFQLNLKVQK